MLAALQAAEAVFVVVGAHAMAVHGVPRATGDLDIWIRPDLENARRVLRALAEFGAPLGNLGAEDLAGPETVYQIGLPPRRIDIITGIDGVDFEEAWESKVISQVAGLDIPFLGWDVLLRNKEASGRPKDMADIQLLRKKRTEKA